MTERLNIIFSQIPKCESFADVGCDHGYIAKAVVASGKSKNVVVSDISEKCLKKAEKLLEREIKDGTCKSVVSDGLKKVPECKCVLIAGLGGEEIIKILSEAPYLPQTLILQPMKNCEKVRLFSVEHGYKIEKDFVFFSSKIYYDLIVLKRGKDELSEEEIEFGRTNLITDNPDFKSKIKWQIDKLSEYIESGRVNEEEMLSMKENRERLKKYV